MPEIRQRFGRTAHCLSHAGALARPGHVVRVIGSASPEQ
jgi:hypothetical protein